MLWGSSLLFKHISNMKVFLYFQSTWRDNLLVYKEYTKEFCLHYIFIHTHYYCVHIVFERVLQIFTFYSGYWPVQIKMYFFPRRNKLWLVWKLNALKTADFNVKSCKNVKRLQKCSTKTWKMCCRKKIIFSLGETA